MFKERAKAIANIVVTMVLFVNAILTASGRNPLPLDQDAVTITITSVLTALDVMWVWFKNQNISVEAEAAQKILDSMKKDRNTPQGTGDPEGDAYDE